MSDASALRKLIEKLDLLKDRLETSTTKDEKLLVLAEFRFLLEAARELIQKGT